jgi:hypothetical protein
VKVETLVLAGTIEEEMLLRAQRMTNAEHIAAKTLEDDGGIREIIQNARCLPLTKEDMEGTSAMAALENPQRLWGRPGWSTGTTTPQAVDNSSAVVEVMPMHQTHMKENDVNEVQEAGQGRRARFSPIVLVGANATASAVQV